MTVITLANRRSAGKIRSAFAAKLRVSLSQT